jgi:hypothetical protein
MDRPRLLPGQAEVVEQPEHPVLAVGDPETSCDDPPEVLGPPGAHPVALGIGTAQHQGAQARHLPLVQPGRPAALGPVAQTVDALGIEPDHPIPERLAVHAGQTGGLASLHALQRVGQTEQPRGDPAIGLASRQPTQLLGRNVVTDRKCLGHHPTLLHCISVQRRESAICTFHNHLM